MESTQGDSAEALHQRGISALQAQWLEDAQACFQQALKIDPVQEASRAALSALQDVLHEKADAMTLHRRGESARAASTYRSILATYPHYPEVLNNLGVLLLQQGDAQGAATTLQAAVASKPGLASAHSNLGAALKRRGLHHDAVISYQRAIALEPGTADTHFNLGHALVELQRLPEAITAYERALAIDPGHPGARASLAHQRRHLCDWHAFDEDSNALRALVQADAGGVTPFDVLATLDDPGLQLRCARRFSEESACGITPMPVRVAEASPRIRVGYLSSDFRRHPVTWLCADILAHHDRERFEVFAYSHGHDDASEERDRIRRGTEHFIDIRPFDHQRAAEHIRADGIDILVDLNGHTLGARTGILARRPARVQTHWLGYPGSMGADFIDYVIGDAYSTPTTLQDWFTERIVQLPASFQPGSTNRPAPAAGVTRSSCGLPTMDFVFCCFNNAYKLTPLLFASWMRILKAVPESVLWLLDTGEPARANLQRAAEKHGIAASRLVFAARTTLPEYFARLALADLFLDTFPYNAGTTAADALWAGLPILTCAGSTQVARMAGSQLVAAGLPEMIAPSPDAYEQMAVELATDGTALDAIRARAASLRHGPLFDARRFARQLELAFSHMHRTALEGRPPSGFTLRVR